MKDTIREQRAEPLIISLTKCIEGIRGKQCHTENHPTSHNTQCKMPHQNMNQIVTVIIVEYCDG